MTPHWTTLVFTVTAPDGAEGNTMNKPAPAPAPAPAPVTSWSFVSSDADFDGARIVREAADAGLDAFTLARGDLRVTFLTEAYYQRCVARLLPVLPRFIGVVPALGGYRAAGVASHYTRVYTGGDDARTLHAKLVAIETRVRTTIAGVRA